MVHPRYAKRLAFTTPWGDCRAKSCLKNSDPNQRPPPPQGADPCTIKEEKDYPSKVEKHKRNLIKIHQKKERAALKEQKNIELTKQDVEKKKALSLDEGRLKWKLDKNAPGSSKIQKKSRNKKKRKKLLLKVSLRILPKTMMILQFAWEKMFHLQRVNLLMSLLRSLYQCSHSQLHRLRNCRRSRFAKLQPQLSQWKLLLIPLHQPMQ